MRGGLLLAFKINLFHFTEKLKYAYLTESQARANGLNMNTYFQIRGIVGKLEGMFQKIGGDKESLRKAILNGKKGSLKDLNLSAEAINAPAPTKQYILATQKTARTSAPSIAIPSGTFRQPTGQPIFSMNGLGGAGAVTIASASGLLATIGVWVNKVDWGKVISTTKAIATKAKAFVDKAKQTIAPPRTATAPIIPTSNPYSQPLPTVTLPTHTVTASAPKKKDEKEPSNNTALWVAGGLGAACNSIFFYLSLKKGLSGVPEVAI